MTAKTLIFAALSALLLSSQASAGIPSQDPEDRASSAADEIVAMRSTLAREFVKPGAVVDEETFKNVCGAVGKRVRDISGKEGMRIRHAAVKYRNAANAADEREAALIKRFGEDKSLNETTERIEAGGKSFIRYTRPIFVEPACLACHGPGESRPAFIKEKYPDDKAFGFKEGDIRGLISVTAPAN